MASIIDNVEVDIKKVKNDLKEFQKNLDFTVIEGAGGLYCPAYKGKLFSDIIKELNQEAVIVSTVSLGKLNHLLMTLECAKLNNIKVKGIILNKYPRNPTLSEKNFIKELKLFTDTEILGIIPEMDNPTKENIIKIFKDINL